MLGAPSCFHMEIALPVGEEDEDRELKKSDEIVEMSTTPCHPELNVSS